MRPLIVLIIGSFLFAGRILLAQSDADIQALIDNRVDTAKQAVGIVVGTIDPSGSHIYASGLTSARGTHKPDGQTLFEIGSITKVFTSLILADMIERGEVKADDPVSKYLPDGAIVPSHNGKPITLLNLSMQNSGLPPDPGNLDQTDSYQSYDAPKLLAFLGSYKLTRDPGEKFEDSNVGGGLLGFALAQRAHMSYEDLLRQRIFKPLHMDSTTITLSPVQKQHLALGSKSIVMNWDKSAVAGTGGMRSNADDMLKFLAANMGLVDTPLKAAMERMRSVRPISTGQPHEDIAMAWFVWSEFPPVIYMHVGGTVEYRSFAGIDLANKRAALVLCTSGYWIPDVIGRHLLRAAQYPAPMLEKKNEGIGFDSKTLDEYQGTYELQFAPTIAVTVRAREGRLFAQMPNQPEGEILRSSTDEVFWEDTEAKATFTRDSTGRVTGIVIHQNGLHILGPRAKQ